MDMLAHASVVLMQQDEDAAAILHNLQTRCPSPLPLTPCKQGTLAPGGVIAPSNVNVATAWNRSDDDRLKRLAACLPPALSGIDLESMGETSDPASPKAQGDNTSWEKEHGKEHAISSWADVAKAFEGRNEVQCIQRWQKLTHPDCVKGPWSATEDAQLTELVKRFGGKQWARIASMLPGRTGKQCRERWCNNLDPTLKKGAWTPEEDAIILQMHAALGTRWAEIAKSLPGRSDNSVKNRWYSTCSRILRQQQEQAAAAKAALSNFPNLNGHGLRHAPPPLDLRLTSYCSRPTTPKPAQGSTGPRSAPGTHRKRAAGGAAPLNTPSPKRAKATMPPANDRWTKLLANAHADTSYEHDGAVWYGGARGVVDAVPPLMCAEQL